MSLQLVLDLVHHGNGPYGDLGGVVGPNPCHGPPNPLCVPPWLLDQEVEGVYDTINDNLYK